MLVLLRRIGFVSVFVICSLCSCLNFSCWVVDLVIDCLHFNGYGFLIVGFLDLVDVYFYLVRW